MKKQGFTLIEILIYIAILALLSAGVVEVILTLASGAKELRSERRTAAAAELALETLVREIRQASDVIVTSGVFGTSPGKLVLRTAASPGSQTQVNRAFSLVSSRLQRQDDSGASEFITGSEVSISELVFWYSAATSSSLITIKLTSGDKTFYGSAVLRAKY